MATHFSVLAWKTVPGLCCYVGFSLVAASGGYSLVVVQKVFIVVTSLVLEHEL